MDARRGRRLCARRERDALPVRDRRLRLPFLFGPADPNFEGVCTYAKGSESGLLRVRRYVEGAGETPLAVRNDDGLMHAAMSNGGKIMAAFRGGPGPVVDGVQTYQFVLTFALKGYLVDCIARHADKSQPPADFTDACMKLAGE